MTEFVHDLTVGLLIALVFYPLLGILALRFRIENGAIKVINFGIISYEVRHIVINQIREIKLVPTWKIFPLIFKISTIFDESDFFTCKNKKSPDASHQETLYKYVCS